MAVIAAVESTVVRAVVGAGEAIGARLPILGEGAMGSWKMEVLEENGKEHCDRRKKKVGWRNPYKGTPHDPCHVRRKALKSRHASRNCARWIRCCSVSSPRRLGLFTRDKRNHDDSYRLVFRVKMTRPKSLTQTSCQYKH